MPFAPSDGWLLAALYLLKEPATRSDVIKVGDAINHALFTDDEIDGGIVRLQDAGLAEFLGCDKYRITTEGRAFVRAAHTDDPPRIPEVMFAVTRALEARNDRSQ